jgi:hypothetical protein
MSTTLDHYIYAADRHFSNAIDRFEEQVIRTEALHFEKRDSIRSTAILSTMKKTLQAMMAHRAALDALRLCKKENK